MRYGLIGEKLGHSYSKDIHELIERYEYDLKEIPKDGLKDYILSKDYLGLNVTIPYKQDVMPLLDEIDDLAVRIGAVNCIVNTDGYLKGYNTDYYGLRRLIEESNHSIEGKKVLILGTGGTSKTAMTVIEDLGASEILKASRTAKDNNVSYEDAVTKHGDAQIIVNTTPCGMYPNIGVAAIDLKDFKNVEAVFDVVYNPARTKLMLDAQELGIYYAGGLKMLIYQAVKACELFTGRAVSEAKTSVIYNILRNETENIVLIGMPAVGKSTLGKRLSKELKMNFVDTDDLIVEKENRPISDIFANEGEKYFRDVESEVIREVAGRKNTIIATGGGAILRKENVEVLKSFGRLILLSRPLESLLPTDDRPLASDPEKIKRLFNERMPIYTKIADVIIDGGKGVNEEVSEVKRYMNEH